MGNVWIENHCPPPPLLDVGLVAREGRHLHVDVLERDRVDGRRDAVDVGGVRHRLREGSFVSVGRVHQIIRIGTNFCYW